MVALPLYEEYINLDIPSFLCIPRILYAKKQNKKKHEVIELWLDSVAQSMNAALMPTARGVIARHSFFFTRSSMLDWK